MDDGKLANQIARLAAVVIKIQSKHCKQKTYSTLLTDFALKRRVTLISDVYKRFLL